MTIRKQHHTPQNRRLFLQQFASASTAAGLCLNAPLSASPVYKAKPAQQKDPKEPHFFLQVYIPGGMDTSYLFDARPWEMTTANLIQNYRRKSSTSESQWTSQRGGTTALVTELAKPLEKWRTHMSLLNGVQMATSFDGHDQNTNFMLSGNAFGGAALPGLLSQDAGLPLSFVQTGFVFANISNTEQALTLDPSGARDLALNASALGLSEDNPMLNASRRGFLRLAARQPASKLSRGSSVMALASSRMSEVTQRLSTLEIPEQMSSIAMVGEFFSRGMTNCALLVTETGSFDVHDAASAGSQPDLMTSVVSELDRIFTTLSETAFDGERSLFDVTTVLVASEFGRTMRQGEMPVANTGTDHNPLTNSMILAGKGIRPGLIIGESDFQTTDEVLSQAHLSRDPQKFKIMGRAFDFDNASARQDLPEIFNANDYLSVNSVVNTLFDLFGADESLKRSNDRSGPTAPSLSTLLV